MGPCSLTARVFSIPAKVIVVIELSTALLFEQNDRALVTPHQVDFSEGCSSSFVQLGPGLKSETKALDQSRTLNSLWTTNFAPAQPRHHPKLLSNF